MHIYISANTTPHLQQKKSKTESYFKGDSVESIPRCAGWLASAAEAWRWLLQSTDKRPVVSADSLQVLSLVPKLLPLVFYPDDAHFQKLWPLRVFYRDSLVTQKWETNKHKKTDSCMLFFLPLMSPALIPPNIWLCWPGGRSPIRGGGSETWAASRPPLFPNPVHMGDFLCFNPNFPKKQNKNKNALSPTSPIAMKAGQLSVLSLRTQDV